MFSQNVHWSLRDRSRVHASSRQVACQGNRRHRRRLTFLLVAAPNPQCGWRYSEVARGPVHRRCSLTVPQKYVFHSTSLQKVKMGGSIFSTKLASQLSNTGNYIGTLVISVRVPLPILGAFEDISEKCVVSLLNELNGGKM